MNNINEIWKPITYPTVATNRYEVSSVGNIRNTRTGLVLKSYRKATGYLYINLPKEGGGDTNYPVHRLVAYAFLRKDELADEVDHIDGNPANNSIENLRWGNSYREYE